MNSLYEKYLSKIDELLEKRYKVYPIRDQISFDLNKEIENFTEYLIETNDFKGMIPDKKILQITESFYKKGVFVCGSMRSGKCLLAQLLDGHENLIVMPGDSHYVNLFFNSNNRAFFDLVRYWMKRLINPSGKIPYWFLGKEENTYRDFIYYLNYFLKNSNKELFALIVFSVFAANPKKCFNAKYWVERTANNELHVKKNT